MRVARGCDRRNPLIDGAVIASWRNIHEDHREEINVKNHYIAAALLAVGAPAWAQSAAPGALQQEAAHTYALYPAGKVLGLEVHNNSDKNVGEIGDLLVDPRTGEIRYAVLEVGGVLGVGEDHRVVPWSYVQVVTDEKDAEKCHARTLLTEDQVKAAPAYKKDQRYEADLDKRIESAFGKDDSWAYVGKGEPIFVSCRQMDGVVVRDPASKEVGKVQRLIIAPVNGCVAYAVIDTTKDAGDKDVVLPFGKLEYSYDKDRKLTATTPVEITRFVSAPEYDTKDWKRMASTAWMNEMSTYYGCDPFWKNTRFASARKPKAATKP